MWREKLKSGKVRYVERYTDFLGNTKKVSVTFDKHTIRNEKEAYKLLQEKINQDSNTIKSQYTVAEALDMFISQYTKANTIYAYSRALRDPLSPFMEVKLEKLTPVIINRISRPLTKYKKDVLKIFLNYLHSELLTSERLSLYIPKVKKKQEIADEPPKYLEKNEIQEILKKLENGSRYYDRLICYAVEFLLITGLRRGELVGLTKSDIDGNNITVNNNIVWANKIVRQTPKSVTSHRTITINNRGLQLIKLQELNKRINGIDSTVIFPDKKGNFMNPNGFGTMINNRTGHHPHIFRHTHASILASQGVPLEYIQRRLGHSSDRVTKQIYIHIMDEEKNKEADLFKNLKIL